MINPQWLELLMFRTNFNGPKDVRAIEVRLYVHLLLWLFAMTIVFFYRRGGLTLFPIFILLITFANRLDPDQARQNVGPDLDPNCLIL